MGPVLVTRHTVKIVPAAPCCESILIAASRSEHRGVEEVVAVPEPLTEDGVVDADAWPPADDGFVPVPVGTGPASWAPPELQPAAKAMSTAVTTRILVMGGLSGRRVTRRGRVRNDLETRTSSYCNLLAMRKKSVVTGGRPRLSS